MDLKKMSKRLLAMGLTAVMLFGLFACTNLGGGGDTTPPVSTTAPITTAPPENGVLIPEASDLVLLSSLSEYTVVFSETASDALEEGVNAFVAAIAEKTGVTLAVKTDFVAYGEAVPADTKEILIGETNRAESAVPLKADDFTVARLGDRLVLTGGSEEGTLAVLDYAETYLIGASGLSYLKENYTYRHTYPLSSLTIGGVSVDRFTIVRDESSRMLAVYLRDVIRSLTGDMLTIATDRAPETEYEILIGNTGRDETDRALAADSFAYGVDGKKLVAYGSDFEATYYALRDVAKTLAAGETAAYATARTEKSAAGYGMVATNMPTEMTEIVLTKTDVSTGDTPLLQYKNTEWERFLQTKEELPEEITVLPRVTLEDYPLSAMKKEVYVSPEDGNDAWEGTLERPLKTIEAALSAVGGGGGVIWLREGTYSLESALSITGNYSGTATAPLFIKAYGKETPVITTYAEIKTEWFRGLDADDPLYERIDSDASSRILVVDLFEHGFTEKDFTVLWSSGNGYGDNGLGTKNVIKPVMIIGGVECNIARYPNEDPNYTENGKTSLTYCEAFESGRVTSSTASEIYYDWIDRVNGGTYAYGERVNSILDPVPWAISLGILRASDIKAGVWADEVVIEGDYDVCTDWEDYAPILDWVDTGNIWFYGRVYSDWEEGYYNVRIVEDFDGRSETFDPALVSTMPSGLGAMSRSYVANLAHDYYLFNAIEALDAPGEWFIDEESGRMYLYPPDEYYTTDSIYYTGSNDSYAVFLNSLQNAVIDGLTFTGSGTHEIYAYYCNNVMIQNCTFSFSGYCGIYANYSTNMGVIHNVFSRAGSAMLTVRNPNAYNLVPTGNVIQNNTFYDPSPGNNRAMVVGGVRAVISHNQLTDTLLIIDGPAYENVIEYNNIQGGSPTIGDGGLIYMYGLFTRGNHVRNNLLHQLQMTGNCVYNDGMCSGNYTYYNTCVTLTGYRDSSYFGAQKAYYVSTGHDNVCYANLMIVRNREQAAENAGKPETPYGDTAMHESTLFYTDIADTGYVTASKYTDAASYSWDELYKQAVSVYTGGNSTINLELFRLRFPNLMESMEGAALVFTRTSEKAAEIEARYPLVSDAQARKEAHAAVRRELVLEIEATGSIYTEDFFRQPAYNSYVDNVVLGGHYEFFNAVSDPDGDGPAPASKQIVYSDYLVSNVKGSDTDGGSVGSLKNEPDPYIRDLRNIGDNFYHYEYADIIYDADGFDYTLTEEGKAAIKELLPDFEAPDWMKAGIVW